MKEGIHPNYYQAKVVCHCGNEFVTGSTKSRRLPLPADVLISSIVSTALMLVNREADKGLSLKLAQPFCFLGSSSGRPEQLLFKSERLTR